MKIIKVKNNNISDLERDLIVDSLSNNEIVVYPTDTIYGLGVNAFSKDAVKKVYDLKGRKKGDYFSVMVESVDEIKKYASIGFFEEQFLNKYLPGPVTVILKLKPEILRNGMFSKYIVNRKGAVGFRVIKKHGYLNDVLHAAGFPIISTSANKSGAGIIRSNIHFVLKQFKNDLDSISIVIDSGDLGNVQPSTIVDLSQTPYSILRRGVLDVSREDL